MTVFDTSAGASPAQRSVVEVAKLPPFQGASAEAAYTLGAGDRVRVEILQLPQYSGEHEVLVNGSLNLPQIGSLSVRGMTLEQAARSIASKYAIARILRQPRVTVTLLVARPLRIGIAGEIHRPGSYLLPIQGFQLPTVTQALQVAGGITQAADLRKVQVSRRQRSGAEQAIAVDLWQLLQAGDLRNDLTLRDGDTIFIPTATGINLAETPQLASASFSGDKTQPITIAVLGEVRQPGTHPLRGENSSGGLPTVTQAIEVAGGINPLADVHKIQIRRLTKTGAAQIVEIDLWKLLQSGDFQQDLILQNGDTIFVPTAEQINLAEASLLRTASFAPQDARPLNVTIIGEVFRPGPYAVTGSARTSEAGVPGGASGTGGSPTVTRAIQVAGGIKPLADIRRIQIRRLTSTGAERTLEVDLWKLLQDGDSSQDTVLQEGDTITIPLATNLAPEEAAQIAAASFSPDTISVNIVGEIVKPGAIQIPPNTPLNQALLAAGGFTNRANSSSVELIRLNANGTVDRRSLAIDLTQNSNEKTNPPLRNNDVVVVGRSTLAGISDGLDTALGPLGKFLTILSLPFNFFRLF
jgi:polysaccharide export outer membrane protein